MRRTEETKTGKNRTDEKVLGDLDFADIEKMQTKTNCLSNNANEVGVFINVSKTEVLRANCDKKTILLNDKALVMSKDGDCSIDTKNRLGKAWEHLKKKKNLEVKGYNSIALNKYKGFYWSE